MQGEFKAGVRVGRSLPGPWRVWRWEGSCRQHRGLWSAGLGHSLNGRPRRLVCRLLAQEVKKCESRGRKVHRAVDWTRLGCRALGGKEPRLRVVRPGRGWGRALKREPVSEN